MKLLGVALLLGALSGGSAAGESGKETVAGDILAGWARTWQWHATPEGKIWRGDGDGPFIDCYAEWGKLRCLDGNHEQEVFVSPGAWKKAGFNCVFYDAATQSLAIRPRVAAAAETAVTGHAQHDGPYKGRAIFSAMLSLEQLTAACPRNGAWRIVARMPGKGVGGAEYQGAWPAIWLMAHKYPLWCRRSRLHLGAGGTPAPQGRNRPTLQRSTASACACYLAAGDGTRT